MIRENISRGVPRLRLQQSEWICDSTDISFRANFITIDPAGEAEYEDYIVRDHAAGDITTEECAELLKMHSKRCSICRRKSVFPYRNRLPALYAPQKEIIRMHIRNINACRRMTFSTGMPENTCQREKVRTFSSILMPKSYDILKDHPINKARIEKGLNPANSLWIWGQGTRPELPNFRRKIRSEGNRDFRSRPHKGNRYFCGDADCGC